MELCMGTSRSAEVIPWTQPGQIASYGLQIKFSDWSGSIDHDLKGLEGRTGLED